eukprot:m.944008 g.944008  ORF g.944008 m.944008 type:complete len:729 (+) comp23843_c0_seq2:362-2548(+)
MAESVEKSNMSSSSQLASRPTRPFVLPRCSDCAAVIQKNAQGVVNSWWCVNFGAVLCTQCFSCHRALGSHISKVSRELDASIADVVNIISPHVNAVWEASVPADVKPFASADLSAKQEYITAKYLHGQYLSRSSDDEDELTRTLIQCVLTNDMIGAYRALCHGADPNHSCETFAGRCLAVAIQIFPTVQEGVPTGAEGVPTATDKGVGDSSTGPTSLHLAAALGLRDMVELLLLHDADAARIWVDMYADDIARQRGFLDVASRLRRAKNVIADDLHDFCAAHGQTTDTAGEPTVTPLAPLDVDELGNLVVDVYDEVLRRRTGEDWETNTTDEEKASAILVPFLPSVDLLPASRLQSRQKLATLSTKQFVALIVDALAELDLRRSATGSSVSRPTSRRPSIQGTEATRPRAAGIPTAGAGGSSEPGTTSKPPVLQLPPPPTHPRPASRALPPEGSPVPAPRPRGSAIALTHTATTTEDRLRQVEDVVRMLLEENERLKRVQLGHTRELAVLRHAVAATAPTATEAAGTIHDADRAVTVEAPSPGFPDSDDACNWRNPAILSPVTPPMGLPPGSSRSRKGSSSSQHLAHTGKSVSASRISIPTRDPYASSTESQLYDGGDRTQSSVFPDATAVNAADTMLAEATTVVTAAIQQIFAAAKSEDGNAITALLDLLQGAVTDLRDHLSDNVDVSGLAEAMSALVAARDASDYRDVMAKAYTVASVVNTLVGKD